jgi:hypothetical protein
MADRRGGVRTFRFDKPTRSVGAGRCSAAATVRSEAEDSRRSREQSHPLRHFFLKGFRADSGSVATGRGNCDVGPCRRPALEIGRHFASACRVATNIDWHHQRARGNALAVGYPARCWSRILSPRHGNPVAGALAGSGLGRGRLRGHLVTLPNAGDVIAGTGGLRKTTVMVLDAWPA